MTTTISSTASANSSTGAITTQGVGSGLDIASIVDKLVSVASAPLDALKTKETAYQTKVSALASVSSALGTFQTTVASLTTPSAFASLTAAIADPTIAAVTVDGTKANSLPVGNHTLSVTNLAAAQRTASSGFADTTSAVGTGSITIDIGSWDSGYTTFTPNATVGSKTITIDGTNNSLSGIRDAINAAGAGVTASIINDGSGNRLVVASNATGKVNGFRISTTDADGNSTDASGLSQLAFDPTASNGTPQTQHVADAANANFLLDGLAISKPGNQVTDVVDGLTLNLKAVSTSATTFNITRDPTQATSAINAFVSAYNTIVTGLKSLTSYDTTSKTAGALNGDTSVRLISTRLQSLIATVLPGTGSVNSLVDIGVTFGDNGTLTVDSTKLSAALANSPDAVSRLFAKTGTATDALVGYVDSTANTQTGSHALTVSQLASQGSTTGSAQVGQTTIAAGANDTISLTVDNVGISIKLAAGTYADATAIAAQVQSQINGTAALSSLGSSVTVTALNGVLSVQSARYGSASNVTITGGNGANSLFGSAPTSVSGVDVAGTLDGVPFLGQGQAATGASSSNAAGLKLDITGGALGNRGSVSFQRGIAAQVNDTLTSFLDSTNGLLSVETASLNSSIADTQKQEASWNTRLDAIRAQLTAQYNAMDSLVASLNSTGSYLTQQLAALTKSTSSSS